MRKYIGELDKNNYPIFLGDKISIGNRIYRVSQDKEGYFGEMISPNKGDSNYICWDKCQVISQSLPYILIHEVKRYAHKNI